MKYFPLPLFLLEATSAQETIPNHHDRFQCRATNDLPVQYINLTQQSSTPIEYGHFQWEGDEAIRSSDTSYTFNPLRLADQVVAEEHGQMKLDCATGISVERSTCTNTLRDACDAYCELQCLQQCSAGGSTKDLIGCMQAHDLDGCIFKVIHTYWIAARACRKEFRHIWNRPPQYATEPPNVSTELSTTTASRATTPHESTTESKAETRTEQTSSASVTGALAQEGEVLDGDYSSSTIYLVEFDASSVHEVVWKRLYKGSLQMRLASEFVLDPISPEFGNIVDLTTGFNAATCDVNFTDIPYNLLDRPDVYLYNTRFGATYWQGNVTETEVMETTTTTTVPYTTTTTTTTTTTGTAAPSITSTGGTSTSTAEIAGSAMVTDTLTPSDTPAKVISTREEETTREPEDTPGLLVRATPVTIELQISSLLTSSSLHVAGGEPVQLLIWWPGSQPTFANGANNTDSDLHLKVQKAGYPWYYLSTDGFLMYPNSASHLRENSLSSFLLGIGASMIVLRI
eukprot:Blabericola_migrator_1__3463@NODE_2022_length_3403_cov_186_953837_g1285_i0_p1_GENE_NODE_2022_length_3403_cov_186_953837_g1285_i0NODE_2022_length_3403_cov_186_953837_g1285_i0_p1_ORF_typecomplete_len514_score45_87Podoplanin/PF05808_11/0_069Podoplanin/PF05808_11/4_9DUF5585/PF17823_1/5_9DUF5585/PF17823_1/1_1e02_NODE_2022_length_3403_cov_186_953837_g1285_i06192160